MHKGYLIYLTALLLCFSLSSCSLSSESSSESKSLYETQYPPTAMEYNLAVNKKIVLIINLLEGHCSTGDDIIAGKYSRVKELASVEESISEADRTLDSMKLIYPPDNEMQSHSETLTQIGRAIDALMRYKTELQNEDIDSTQLQMCIDEMFGAASSLKDRFNVI